MRALLLVVAALLPHAAAQPTAVDVVVELDAAGASQEGLEGEVVLASRAPDEVAWTLNLTRGATVFELRVDGAFDVPDARNVVPLLRIDARDPRCQDGRGWCEYTLFEPAADERVWEVDDRVFHRAGNASSFVLRLVVPGPVNATLSLERDVSPPAFSLGAVQHLTHIGFYQEATTTELAWGDLQVREKGASRWILNPTPMPHFLHRFPVQGLDAGREYEYRFRFEDPAGNVAESAIFSLVTPPAPEVEKPGVAALSPRPDAVVSAEGVAVRAVVSGNVTIPRDGIRVFFDKREVSAQATVIDGVVSYYPGRLAPGRHAVAVEAVNEDGGMARAVWSFEVEGAAAARAVPGAPLALVLAGLLMAAAARRR